MTHLIVGCGYLGLRIGRLLAARGGRVIGTVRSPARAAVLESSGIEPRVADVLLPEAWGGLPDLDVVFYCVGFDRAAGLAMRTVYVEGVGNVLDQLASRSRRWVYASSSSVYGQADGRWVTEDDPAEPTQENGKVCLDAERRVRSTPLAGGQTAIVVRLSGLYGPGRIPRRDVVSRGEVIEGNPETFLNWIQVDDAARSMIAAADRGRDGATYLVSDDRPIARGTYCRILADLLGAPSPRFLDPTVPLAAGPDKRLSNRRLREELEVVLSYPDVREGLAAAVQAEHDEAAAAVAKAVGPSGQN